MDANRFDDLLRALTEAPSRRGFVRAITGLVSAGPLATLLGAGETEARKKKKKKCKRGKKKCGKKCIPSTTCCSSADCGFQGACESGVCDCKSGARFCLGKCIPEGDCCASAECPAGTNQTCQNGQCACPPTQPAVCGDGSCHACCSDCQEASIPCECASSCNVTCSEGSIGTACCGNLICQQSPDGSLPRCRPQR